jgi:hypothetical protein
MHTELAPSKGPTIEVYQDMDEPINKFLKTKKQKKK